MNDALRLILQNLENLIRFRVGTMAQYEALASKDEGTLYFITDKGVFYKGAQLFVGIKEAAVVTEGTGTSQVHVLSLTPSIGDTLTFTTTSQEALQAMLAALRSELVTIIETQATDEVMGRVYLSDAVDSTLDAETGGTAATPKAVKSALEIAKEYADGLVAANDAMVLKGTIGDTEAGADVSALPTTDYKTGWTYIVVTAGTYAGNVCEIGDKIMCVNDYTADTASNADWSVFQANIDGAVTSADQLTDGSVIVGAGGSSVKTLGNGTSKQVLTIDPVTLKPVWADNVAQGIENPTRLTGTMATPQQGWIRVVISDFANGGRLYIVNAYNTSVSRELIMDLSFTHGSYTPYFNLQYSKFQNPLFTKFRILRKGTNLNYLEFYYQRTDVNALYVTYDMAHYNANVSLPLINVPDEPEEGYRVDEYDLVNGVQSNLPYVSTEGLQAPKLGNGDRTMDVEDIIARDSVNAIPAGVSSITQLRTGDSTYPYAFIAAVSPLAITSNNTEVYGLSIAKSASASYTYNGIEYSVTNPNASYAVSVFLIRDSNNMFLKGTTYPFNLCSVAKSYVTVNNGRILAVREIVEGIYELIVNQQSTTIIKYPSSLTLRMFKKSNNTGDYTGQSSVASGYKSVASGNYSVASGHYSVASGRHSVASGNESVASGQSSVASGNESVASGQSSVASGNYSVASGHYSVASGNESVASGQSSVASGQSSVASGYKSVASGRHSVASGHYSVASGDYSAAMNRSTKATGTSQTVVGQYNDTDDDAYFIVGNGTSETARSNAMKVTKSGYVKAVGIGNDTRNINMADIIARENLDTEVTEKSTNPVTSQGISNAIEDAITEIVNQLVWQTIGE